jgi:hypothetical protein
MGNASPTRDSALKTMSPDATDRIASPAPLPGQTSVGSAAPTPQVVLSQPLESPAPAPAVSTVPALSPALVEQKPSAANAAPAVSSKAPLTRMEPGMAPIHAAQNSNATAAMARGSGSVEKELQVARTGLTLWNEPELARAAAKEEAQQLQPPTQGQVQAAAPEPQVPWTLGGDLEKYRAHAVKDGSRNSGENLKKALERAGMAVGDGVNVFLLGYASDRAKPFRENDGKSIFDEPGKVPARAGATIASFGYALYSIADVVTLNALPDPNRPAYKDNNVLVRPFIFTGRTVVGVWKTTEEVGNALTWGLFDNVTGCVGLVIEDVVEFLKHAGEAVTNVVRAPFHLAAGKKPHEGTDQAMDWILLVPLELASNAVEMKGFSNMQDYKTAFADKGVIGSVLEFGGSTYIVYQAVDKVVDKCKKNNKSNQTQSQSQSQSQTGQPSGSNTTGTGTTGTSTGTTGTSTAGTDTGGIVTTSDTGGTYTETITYPSATNTTPVGGGDAYFFFDPTDGTIITGQ